MELLQDDYLGGSGSRGSGQIEFKNIKMVFKSRACYENAAQPITIAENIQVTDLSDIDYLSQILEAIQAE